MEIPYFKKLSGQPLAPLYHLMETYMSPYPGLVVPLSSGGTAVVSYVLIRDGSIVAFCALTPRT